MLRPRRMKNSAILLLCGVFLPACNGNDGSYSAYLLLIDQSGEKQSFSLGSKYNLSNCAGVGEDEIESSKKRGGVFWANPDFDYGGYKAGDDWMPYEVAGFMCVKNGYK